MYSSALNPNNVPAGNAKYMKQWIQDYVNIETVRKCFKCGERIYAGTAVYMATDGKIYTYQTSDDDTYIGVAAENAKANESADVVLQGYLRVPGAPWSAGVLYYTNAVGTLTPVPVTRRVAVGVGDSEIVVYTQFDTGGGGGITTADNGLTVNVPGNVQLGGTLLQNTTIDATASYNLNVTGSVPNATRLGALYVENTNTTAAAAGATAIYVKGTSKATGIYATSIDGFGIYAQSTNNYGIRAFSTNTDGIYGRGLTAGVRGQSNAANAYGVIGSGLGTNSNGVWGLGNITNGAGFLGFGYYGFKSEASVPIGAYLTGNLIAADLNSPALPLRSTLDSSGRDGVIDAAAEFRRIDTSVGPAPLAGTGVGTWSFLQDNAGTERRVGVSGYILTDGTAGNIKTLYQHIIESGAGTSRDVHDISYTGQHKFPLYGDGLFTGTVTQLLAVDTDGNIIEAGGGTALPLAWHGSFYDTTDQSATAPDTPTAMKLNTTDFSSGVSITNNGSGDPTRITFANAGRYNVQFSAQIYRSSGGSKETITIWLRKQGTNVPYSSTFITIQANTDYHIAAWNFFVDVTAGQYVELVWSTTDTNITIQSEPENLVVPYPAIPGLIVTANRVG